MVLHLAVEGQFPRGGAAEDARALLFILAQATQRRAGRRASISPGAVGKGALGDERTYRSLAAELVEDVASPCARRGWTYALVQSGWSWLAAAACRFEAGCAGSTLRRMPESPVSTPRARLYGRD